VELADWCLNMRGCSTKSLVPVKVEIHGDPKLPEAMAAEVPDLMGQG